MSPSAHVHCRHGVCKVGRAAVDDNLEDGVSIDHAARGCGHNTWCRRERWCRRWCRRCCWSGRRHWCRRGIRRARAHVHEHGLLADTDRNAAARTARDILTRVESRGRGRADAQPRFDLDGQCNGGEIGDFGGSSPEPPRRWLGAQWRGLTTGVPSCPEPQGAL